MFESILFLLFTQLKICPSTQSWNLLSFSERFLRRRKGSVLINYTGFSCTICLLSSVRNFQKRKCEEDVGSESRMPLVESEILLIAVRDVCTFGWAS